MGAATITTISANANKIPAADDIEKAGDKSTKLSWRTVLTIMAFCLCLFQTGLDAIIISNALPLIMADLGLSINEVALVGSAYTLAWGSLLMAWAGISNVVGRKPILLAGLLCFMGGSALAAVSTNMTMLLAGRVVQGMGACACLSSVSYSIADIFTLSSVYTLPFLFQWLIRLPIETEPFVKHSAARQCALPLLSGHLWAEP
jgi:MFS family permease